MVLQKAWCTLVSAGNSWTQKRPQNRAISGVLVSCGHHWFQLLERVKGIEFIKKRHKIH